MYMQDVNQLKEVRPSVSMELQTQELGEVGVHGRRTRESWIGANAMKQTLFNCFLKAKEAIAKAISGSIKFQTKSFVFFFWI